jgi:phage repressor protein C with HTH and peptisase S24 domain
VNNIEKLARTMGISIGELARRIDMQPHTLRRYARNESQPKPDLAIKIASVFGVDPAEVLGFAVAESNPLAKIPLYGSAEAGVGSDITDMDRAIDHIDRPPFLLSATSAYAVYVVGESMVPRFKSGEILYVDPAVPIRRGADCIIQLADNLKLSCIVKEYVKATDTDITVKQFNPDKQITIPKSRVTSIHLVRGSYIT